MGMSLAFWVVLNECQENWCVLKPVGQHLPKQVTLGSLRVGQTQMSLLEEAERADGDGLWTGASIQPSYLL